MMVTSSPEPSMVMYNADSQALSMYFPTDNGVSPTLDASVKQGLDF